MYLNLAFSRDAFARLLMYRLMEQFRPLTTPVEHPAGSLNWLDGLVIDRVDLGRVVDGQRVPLNESGPNATVRPVPESFIYLRTAVTIDVGLTLHLARVEDVAAAGLAQPPTNPVAVPASALHVTVRATVDADGIPHLLMELDVERLRELGLPGPIVDRLRAAATQDVAFDIAGALEDILPAGNNRVLNAGVTVDDDDNVLVRLEFPDTPARSAATRWQEWENFATSPALANLGSQDWSVDVDGTRMAAQLAQRANPMFRDQKPVAFDPTWIDSSFQNGVPPRVIVKKLGRIENACAGNDVRFDAFLNADISVPPQGNTVRTTVGFDVNKNDWDVAKCFGMFILNPLSILITSFDQGQVGIGFAELAISLVFPTRPLIALSALTLLIAGVDKALAQQVVADLLADEPSIEKLPDGRFAFQQDVNLANPLTRNWLVLREAVGEGGRLLLRGALQVPPPILPRLKATDLEGFFPWHLADRCEPGRGQATTARLSLDLEAGYGADPAASARVRPTIPLRYGTREDGTTVIYEVLNDRLGVYQDRYADYTQIHLPGIPGVLEATLKSSTVRKEMYRDFAQLPYPLRLRLYTNAGVREYEFAAPVPYQEYSETIAQAAERINKCKQLGHDLALRKYLELIWRVDPPPDALVAQHWQISIAGLEPGRRVNVWHPDNGTLLGRFQADHFGQLDADLVVPPTEFASSLLLSLDDAPFLDRARLRELQETPVEQAGVTTNVAARQSLLVELGQLTFREPVASVHAAIVDGRPTVAARLQSGRLTQPVMGLHRGVELPVRAIPVSDAALRSPSASAPSRQERDERHRGEMALQQDDVTTHNSYVAEWLHDVETGGERIVARASADRRVVALYQQSAAQLIGAWQWKDRTSGGREY